VEIVKLDLYSAESPRNHRQTFTDFMIGRIKLAKHLDVQSDIGVLSVDKCYAKQLLLLEASFLESGRVPLYVCSCCADLGCGAITVSVEQIEDTIIWSDFGWEGPSSDDFTQSGYLKHTGPFYFDFEQYKCTLYPYTHS